MDEQFECSVADYWDRVFLTEAFQESLHLEGLGYRSYQRLEHREAPGALVHRSIEVTGVPGLPRVLQKLFPSGGYIEKGVLDRNLNRWSFTIEPRGVGGLVHVQGEVRLTELGSSRCRRAGEVEVRVRLPGVGRAASKSLGQLTDELQRKSGAFTQRFISELDL
jgi:hypothetical protein